MATTTYTFRAASPELLINDVASLANADVAAANVNPLEHYLMFGIYEGRQMVNDGIWH